MATLDHPSMSGLPIACTLGPAAIAARREDLLGTLVRRAEERIDLPNGDRVRFNSEAGLLRTIADVIEVERQCCRFLRFEVIVESDQRSIWLEFGGQPGSREFLAPLPPFVVPKRQEKGTEQAA